MILSLRRVLMRMRRLNVCLNVLVAYVRRWDGVRRRLTMVFVMRGLW